MTAAASSTETLRRSISAGLGEATEIIAARAIGVGVGLLTLMIAWLVGNRLLGLVLDAPEGPTAAFITALILGVLVALVAGQRWVRSISRDVVTPRATRH